MSDKKPTKEEIKQALSSLIDKYGLAAFSIAYAAICKEKEQEGVKEHQQKQEAGWKAVGMEAAEWIEAHLRHRFAKVDAFCCAPGAIKVRVVDPLFKGKTIDQRHDRYHARREPLPHELQDSIVTLYLLAPEQVGGEAYNEFSVAKTLAEAGR